MIASIFDVFIVKPIFNLLVFIYAALPGHNFGLSIIIFTVLVRFMMWPLVKKQLHQAKAMRELQPEIKRIKQATKGNKQKESMMLMELYKEREINPLGSIGTLVIQLIILLGLYSGLNKVVHDPQALISYSYSWLHSLDWIKTLAADIGRFDATLFGVVDLKRAATSSSGFYFPAFVLVAGSAISQFYQSKQLMPQPKDGRKLREILKDASSGKQAEQSEVNAAVGQSTKWLIPGMIFLFTIGLPAALSLYWLTSGVTAYLQQARILNQDEQEMESIADSKTPRTIIEGEIVDKKQKPGNKKHKSASSKKRRKK